MQYFFSNVNFRVESVFLFGGTGQENTGKRLVRVVEQGKRNSIFLLSLLCWLIEDEEISRKGERS